EQSRRPDHRHAVRDGEVGALEHAQEVVVRGRCQEDVEVDGGHLVAPPGGPTDGDHRRDPLDGLVDRHVVDRHAEHDAGAGEGPCWWHRAHAAPTWSVRIQLISSRATTMRAHNRAFQTTMPGACTSARYTD